MRYPVDNIYRSSLQYAEGHGGKRGCRESKSAGNIRYVSHVYGGQRATKPTCTKKTNRTPTRQHELFSRHGRTDERTDGRADTTACAALSKRTKRSRPGWPSARRPPSARERLARLCDGRRHAIFPQRRKNGENTCRKYVRETRVSERTNFCTFSVSHRRLTDFTRNVTNGPLATQLTDIRGAKHVLAAPPPSFEFQRYCDPGSKRIRGDTRLPGRGRCPRGYGGSF